MRMTLAACNTRFTLKLRIFLVNMAKKVFVSVSSRMQMAVNTTSLITNEATKKSQGDDTNEMTEQPIILSQPNNERCPVKSFKSTSQKLTDIEDFFQQKSSWRKHDWAIHVYNFRKFWSLSNVY